VAEYFYGTRIPGTINLEPSMTELSFSECKIFAIGGMMTELAPVYCSHILYQTQWNLPSLQQRCQLVSKLKPAWRTFRRYACADSKRQYYAWRECGDTTFCSDLAVGEDDCRRIGSVPSFERWAALGGEYCGLLQRVSSMQRPNRFGTCLWLTFA
jgi:hypothetical protein